MQDTIAYTWLRPEEAAEILRVSRVKVYRLIRGGELSAARLPGGMLRLRTRDVLALLDDKREDER